MRPPPRLSQLPRYPVVAGTALLAIAVSLAWWAKIDMSPLFETAMIRRGEVWRLVTSPLLHLGVLHLIFNVYWLWVFGTLIEETFGHFKTAALIVLLALGSGAWDFALASGGVGLSGVGYGLFGMLWMLSRHDERFRDAVDPKTVRLFIGWFFLCIVLTVTNVMPVGNIAHGVGAVVGVLIGLAITMPDSRGLIASGLGAILFLGLWGATLGRPRVNLSQDGGYEEAQWGYEALMASKNQEALRWLRDAVLYQPKNANYWYNLGIAYHRIGDNRAAATACRTAADFGHADAQFILASSYEDGVDGLPKDSTQALYWYHKLAEQHNAEALNNVAWAYATSSDPAIQNPSAALEYARMAVDMEKDHPVPNHLDTLAAALYVNNKYDDAAKTEEQALTLASSDAKTGFQNRLKKYQAAQKDQNSRATK